MLNIGIIGAGNGGSSILNTLLSVPDLNIIGICDTDSNAPGIKLAKKNNLPVFINYKNLLKGNNEKIIIEVTGNKNIRDKIISNANNKTIIVDASIALLICKIVNSREIVIQNLEEKSAKLANIAGNLSTTIQETSTISKEITKNLDNAINDLIKIANEDKNNINETNEIIRFIKNVANQTKMLGFNAAIEANRAGNEGNGFRVVANEIRKLADETGESVKKITHFINELNDSTKNTITNIDEMQIQNQEFIITQNKISDTLINVSNQIQEFSSTLANLSKI